MKVLVTGANGQLGWDLVSELKERGHVPIATDIQCSYEQECIYIKLDITNEKAVHEVIAKTRPDAVVHCAAWTAVDAAEEDDNKLTVYAINVLGTKYVAEACKQIDCKMIYISTDYVFNGKGTEPWKPDCEDFAPLNYYGETKLEGEFAVKRTLEKYYIVRTSWVFGSHGNNFVKTMLKLSEIHDEVRVVNDQIGTPTYTRDFAKLLVRMCETNKYGIYHATNDGEYISWAEFAEQIFRITGKETRVIPVTTDEYGASKAKRPKNSRMSKSKLKNNGIGVMPSWKEALNDFVKFYEL